MMSLEAIRETNRRAAETAARRNLRPFIVWEQDIQDWKNALLAGITPRLPFPNLGSYCPPDWELIDTFFVDTSGVGAPDEPALTLEQFLGVIEPDFGYAIVEIGEFQAVIGKFRPPYRR